MVESLLAAGTRTVQSHTLLKSEPAKEMALEERHIFAATTPLFAEWVAQFGVKEGCSSTFAYSTGFADSRYLSDSVHGSSTRVR